MESCTLQMGGGGVVCSHFLFRRAMKTTTNIWNPKMRHGLCNMRALIKQALKQKKSASKLAKKMHVPQLLWYYRTYHCLEIIHGKCSSSFLPVWPGSKLPEATLAENSIKLLRTRMRLVCLPGQCKVFIFTYLTCYPRGFFSKKLNSVVSRFDAFFWIRPTATKLSHEI